MIDSSSEIGQMVSYAFLAHRHPDKGTEATTALATNGGAATVPRSRNDETASKNVSRKEAFIERLIEYILKTELGPSVLLRAVHGARSDDYRIAVHSRQARKVDEGVIPDFEVVYHSKATPGLLRILLELKIGSPLNENQRENYPTVRAACDVGPDVAYLVVLAPKWQTPRLSFPGAPNAKVQSITFDHLSAAARELASSGGGSDLWTTQVELWNMIETLTNGLDVAVPPLANVAILNSRQVVDEVSAWFQYFHRIASRLNLSTAGGFSTTKANRLPFEAGMHSDGWGIDFGECGYFDELDSHKRSPIWFSRRTDDKWIVWPMGLGLDADRSHPMEFEAAMTLFAAEMNSSKMQSRDHFIGRGATPEFEFAREILWSAMFAASVRAREIDNFKSFSALDGPGIRINGRDGNYFDVLISMGSPDCPGLRIVVGPDRIDPTAPRGQDYVIAVARRVGELLSV